MLHVARTLWNRRNLQFHHSSGIKKTRNHERETRTGSHGQLSLKHQTKDWFFCLRANSTRSAAGFVLCFTSRRRENRGRLFPFRFCVPFRCGFVTTIGYAASNAKRGSLFFLFFIFLRRRKKTGRVNTDVVVHEAFNQNAWKILFTRSRATYRPPLYRLYVFLCTCTHGSLTQEAGVPRLTPRFRAT